MSNQGQDNPGTRSDAPADVPAGSPELRAGLTQGAPERTSSSPPQTLEEFIIAAYRATARKVSLKPKALAALHPPPELPESLYTSLAPVIESASGLTVTLELLLLLSRFKGELRLRSLLANFIGRCLRAHPAFASSPELQAVLANQPEAAPPRSALRLLAERKTPVPADQNSKVQNRSESAERHTAIACLALWMHETRDYSLEAMTQDLHAVLWEHAAERLKDESAQLRALLTKPMLHSLGLVGRTFRRLADEQRTAADNARKAESHARARVESLSSELERATSVVRFHETRIRAIESELVALRSQRAIDLSHAVDDQARLRGRISRLLTDASTLLEEGLHALRREPPKTAVMDDHAERALAALKGELRNLQSGAL